MKRPSLPIPHEQRKIEKLLIALAKKKPVSPFKPAPISKKSALTGTDRVFFSS